MSDDERKPLLSIPRDFKYASRFVIDVAVLDGKWEIRDGETDVDEVTGRGTVKTRQRIDGANMFHVEHLAELKEGKLYAYTLYHYFGRITVEQRTVRPEHM